MPKLAFLPWHCDLCQYVVRHDRCPFCNQREIDAIHQSIPKRLDALPSPCPVPKRKYTPGTGSPYLGVAQTVYEVTHPGIWQSFREICDLVGHDNPDQMDTNAIGLALFRLVRVGALIRDTIPGKAKSGRYRRAALSDTRLPPSETVKTLIGSIYDHPTKDRAKEETYA